MKNYEQILGNYTKGGTPVKNLSRAAALFRECGDPQNKLRFVHIAGTNGKGSLAEYTANALTFSHKRTGSFTSPFVRNIRERIRLDGAFISECDFAEYINQADYAVKRTGIVGFSQFEVLTAAAFLYFCDKQADIVVLECGIGGLLDCTNVIGASNVAAAVIAAVGIDHAEILGDTVGEIAANKAGIVKHRRPLVLYPIQPNEARAVIAGKCAEEESRLVTPRHIDITDVSLFGNTFSYKGVAYHTKMGGIHQIYNAATAIETLLLLNVPTDCIRRSLEETTLPARCEVISKKPLVVVDGAHNPHGVAATCELLGGIGGKKTVVFGMVTGKNYEACIGIAAKHFDEFVFTDTFAPNAVPSLDLACAAKKSGISDANIHVLSNEYSANDALLFAESRSSALTAVMGSLYLASQIDFEKET
ncbi:MAG: bifunctional folylpolyglutamate synthase/dihydrofolate synthase [Oscillospiraceae bacterium]|jgi:dihydrofolate synthase/folylpolyglutamate synthase|nr:bifunctional folylpolyglutamate synthase/dihydrofolate synthase [Oscillospiraceae bacterium]